MRWRDQLLSQWLQHNGSTMNYVALDKFIVALYQAAGGRAAHAVEMPRRVRHCDRVLPRRHAQIRSAVMTESGTRSAIDVARRARLGHFRDADAEIAERFRDWESRIDFRTAGAEVRGAGLYPVSMVVGRMTPRLKIQRARHARK